MKTKIVGIDYSLNAPAFCMMNGDEYNFLSFISENSLNKKSKSLIYDINKLDGVTIIQTPHEITKDTYIETLNIIQHSDFIFHTLKQHLNEDFDNIKFIFEGFSFMSRSSKLYQFAGGNYYLRERIIQNAGTIVTSPPSSIKRVAGKGNATKHQMIEFFLEKAPASPFKTWLEDYWPNRKTKSFMKPLDDIVDAYWIAYFLKDSLKNTK